MSKDGIEFLAALLTIIHFWFWFRDRFPGPDQKRMR